MFQGTWAELTIRCQEEAVPQEVTTVTGVDQGETMETGAGRSEETAGILGTGTRDKIVLSRTLIVIIQGMGIIEVKAGILGEGVGGTAVIGGSRI